MKFRTDFVTNSSSSSFSIVVAIRDKNGKTYSFQENPYEYDVDAGGTCWFGAHLGSLLVKDFVHRIKNSAGKEFKLEDVGAEGRNARIEHVTVGDELSLVALPGDDGIKVDVRSKEGSVGLLPREAIYLIKDAIVSDAVDVKALVSSVKPLSKRSRSAKYALITVTLDADETTAGKWLMVDSVSELAEYLMAQVHDDHAEKSYFWDEEEDEAEEDDFEERIAARKAAFVEEVTTHIDSLDEIAAISVHREYSAWGEYADLIPDNDEKLCDLAAIVNGTQGEEQEAALSDMLAYIRSSSPDRCGEHFGGYDDTRYFWEGGKEELIALAKRLHSGYGPDVCEGREHDEIDLISGTVESYAEFNLC